jgi:hypothetical protein
MTTPQQFLEAFLQEKSSVYAEANVRLEPVYAKYFDEQLSQHADSFLLRDRQVVDEVKQFMASATVITRAHFRTADIRTRYHLSAVGESWKIVRIDRECFICCGTGLSGTTACKRCAGEGWFDPRQNGG